MLLAPAPVRLLLRRAALWRSAPWRHCVWCAGCGRPLAQPRQVALIGLYRLAATQPKPRSDDKQLSGSVLEQIIQDRSKVVKPTTAAQKVKQGAADLTYVALAVAGVVCLGAFAYLLTTEMFTSGSPQRVFGRSLELVRNDDQCRDLFGTPIKGFGEENRRGRRRQLTYLQYDKDGEHRLRMVFYLKGPLAQGAAHLEMRMDEGGGYEYRYLYVETDEFPPKTRVLVDNRT